MAAGEENVKHLEDCSVSKAEWRRKIHLADPNELGLLIRALGTWFFSVAGALVAIPVGIKKKSLAPLVFFGTTGTMLDIILGISQCEREHAERQMKILESQNAASSIIQTDTDSESGLQ